jgi:1,4-alpha-glucan branching enzyme
MNKPILKNSKLGSTLIGGGVAFSVWAPHADSVAVVGDFNRWDPTQHPMKAGENGRWHLFVPDAKVGDQYKYEIANGDQRLLRIDPYSREVTNSVGNSVVYDTHAFDWGDDDFQLPNFNELVIYELHIGTFNRTKENSVGTFDCLMNKLEYLQWLGVNTIEIMPVAEFAGDYSWGYNPAHLFAVESAYGGPNALKRLVKAAHEHGIAVIMDVVYNHFGPSDLDLWRFDGWSEKEKGGIYFYNDWRSSTPWGESRPDYGRGEVRSFIHDNAMMWLEEYKMDGLRYDMTLYIRTVDGTDGRPIPEGWSLMQWINRKIQERFPNKITIAEDLRTNSALTKPEAYGGANFSTQWDESFVHPIRQAITLADDQHRSMHSVFNAVFHRYNHDAFERVVYTESHDEVANGKQRVPSEIDQNNPHGWYAKRRSALGAVLVFTAPGIPMIFQGQEFVRTDWFDDTKPIDWEEAGKREPTMRMYRDLIGLRLNKTGTTAGLSGSDIYPLQLNDKDKVIAFERCRTGAIGGKTIVVLNFGNRDWTDYRLGFPVEGTWKVRLNSASICHHFDQKFAVDAVQTQPQEHDGSQQSAQFPLAAYSALIFSQD